MRPAVQKFKLWRESGKGFKTRLDSGLNSPVIDRDDVATATVDQSITRGDRSQELRLKHYPSINVDRDRLFAGSMEGDVDDARERLLQMGYRNNPTAYVEVTDENGPDDGSFARQYITETQASGDRERLTNFPAPFKRVKRQIHVVVFELEDEVEFLAHDETSAWLQPMLHVSVNDVKARRGVQEFRLDWFDEFGEELGGESEVKWEIAH